MAIGAAATECDKVIEVVGADGVVTTVIQHPDGGVEIRTDAMARTGRAVHSPARGSARVVDL